jgi:hypothetical protein
MNVEEQRVVREYVDAVDDYQLYLLAISTQAAAQPSRKPLEEANPAMRLTAELHRTRYAIEELLTHVPPLYPRRSDG